MSDLCPCGRGLAYARCCGPLHAGAIATDAEALMRSRYSAYVLALADYLLATWHPDTRPASISFDPQLRWLGLSVRSHQPIDAAHAEVAFVARCRLGGGSAQRHVERSRFERIDGRWLYRDGVVT